MAGQTPGEEILTLIRSDFAAAAAGYVSGHKSRHWDIFDKDYAARFDDAENWDNFRNNGMSSGLDHPTGGTDARHVIVDPRAQAGLVAKYDSLRAITGPAFIAKYHEAEVGQPNHYTHAGIRLNVTDLRLVHAAWRLSTLIDQPRPVIAEIGAGFGGLAVKLKRLYPDARIVLFDLPEVNALQRYYVGRNFPSAKIVGYAEYQERGDAGDYDFAILPGWAINDFPAGSMDCVINMRSMMEMTQATVAFYFSAIEKCLRAGGLFYCVNRYRKTTSGDDVRIKEYPFDDRWYLALSEPVWDQEKIIHEIGAVRTARANVMPASVALRSLPPYRPRDILRHGGAVGKIVSLTLGDWTAALGSAVYRNLVVPAYRLMRRVWPKKGTRP